MDGMPKPKPLVDTGREVHYLGIYISDQGVAMWSNILGNTLLQCKATQRNYYLEMNAFIMITSLGVNL